MKHLYRAGFTIVLLSLLFVASIAQASGGQQEELPTPTPAPETGEYVQLSSGHHFRLDRSISYGDIAVVAAISILILISSLDFIERISTRWLR